MTGIYEHWYSSTLHNRWGLCDSRLGGGSSFHSEIKFGRSRTCEGSSGRKEEGGGVREEWARIG